MAKCNGSNNADNSMYLGALPSMIFGKKAKKMESVRFDEYHQLKIYIGCKTAQSS
jgi:hypothetical protein